MAAFRGRQARRSGLLIDFVGYFPPSPHQLVPDSGTGVAAQISDQPHIGGLPRFDTMIYFARGRAKERHVASRHPINRPPKVPLGRESRARSSELEPTQPRPRREGRGHATGPALRPTEARPTCHLSRMPPTPVLHTPRLVLRPLRSKDAPVIQRRFAQWEVVRWLATPICPGPIRPTAPRAYVASCLGRWRGARSRHWAIVPEEGPGRPDRPSSTCGPTTA